MQRTLITLFALPAAVACGPSDGRGEIMIVVTSDLALPTDLDWLDWSVTLDGADAPYRSGSNDLVQTGLPATLALVSGPHTSAPVRVELVARRGGRNGAVRVVRSARIAVPDHGVRELSMPLSFLCAAGARYTQCAAGATCDAGKCVPELVENESALPSYEPRPATCFDALDCFEPTAKKLRLDGEEPSLPNGGCVFDGTDASPAPNANVALVVNTGLVGNFGGCLDEPNGACLVPVPHGGPGGWGAPPGSSEIVELPAGVCEALRSDFATLTIAEATRECPKLAPGTPLCAEEEVCLTPVATCPESFGPSWTGYSCSGSAARSHPELTSCYRPDRDPERVPEASDLYCCPGDEQPSTEPRDPMLIDDMSLGPQLKLAAPQPYVPGFWWTSVSDEPSTAISPTPGGLFQYRELDPAITTQSGVNIERAACLSAPEGFFGLIAMQGFDLLKTRAIPGTTPESVPLDVSGYDGIRFHALAASPLAELVGAGPDVLVLFPNAQTSRESPDADCEQATDCSDFRALVRLETQWTEHFVRFDALRQEPGEPAQVFDPRLYSILFAIKGREQGRRSQPFDFCISQIYFFKDAHP